MLAIIAEGIATGHTTAADICFLVGVILAALAALGGSGSANPLAPWVAPLAAAAVAAVSLGLLLL